MTFFILKIISSWKFTIRSKNEDKTTLILLEISLHTHRNPPSYTPESPISKRQLKVTVFHESEICIHVWPFSKPLLSLLIGKVTGWYIGRPSYPLPSSAVKFIKASLPTQEFRLKIDLLIRQQISRCVQVPGSIGFNRRYYTST